MVSENRSRGDGGEAMAATKTAVVQRIMEIVGDEFSEHDIVAALNHCNMDPNDAVQRLLAQDTFREVKSKRERRKEMKELQEMKAQLTRRVLSSGSRRAIEHSFGKSESLPCSLSSQQQSIEKARSQQLPLSCSDFSTTANKRQSAATGDTSLSSMQSPSKRNHSPSVVTNTTHVSLAGIVRNDEQRGTDQNRRHSSRGTANCSHTCSSGESLPWNDDITASESSNCDLRNLSLGRGNVAVVLPLNMEALEANCSHLSFGTFRGGIGSKTSAIIPDPPRSKWEEANMHKDGSTRRFDELCHQKLSFEYRKKENEGHTYYSLPGSSQLELLSEILPERTQTRRHMSHLPFSESKLENSYLPSSSVCSASTDPENWGLPGFTNELASKLGAFALRQTSSQTMPNISSVAGPQSSSQILPHVSPVTGPLTLQQLNSIPESNQIYPEKYSRNEYDRPNQSLGDRSIPSALEQTYSGSNSFPESLDAMKYCFSERKRNAHTTGMSALDATNSGYSLFGSSGNIFSSYASGLPGSTVITNGYDDGFEIQDKDRNSFAHMQNDNSIWSWGTGSRTSISAAGTYGGLRDRHQNPDYQQPLQHFGAAGVKGIHPETGFWQEQWQNLGDSVTNGSQYMSSKVSNQLWSHIY